MRYQRRIISLSYWLSTFCEGAVRIIIPVYFYSIGISATKIAVLFVFYEMAGMITNMFSGLFINRFGHKKAFLISLLLHTLSSFGYLMVDVTSFLFSALLLNVCRSFRGSAKELIKTTSTSYFKHISKSHLDSHLLLGGKDSVKGVGLLLGGVALTFLSFKMSFFILGVLTLVCMVFAFYFVNDIREKQVVSLSNFFSVSSHMVLLAMIRGLLYMGRDIWLVIGLPVYFHSLGISTVTTGAYLALGWVVFGVVQPLTGLIVKSEWSVGRLVVKSKWFYVNIIPAVTFLLMLMPLAVLTFNMDVRFILPFIIGYNVFAGLATAPHNYLQLRFAKSERASVDISFYKTLSQLGKVIALFMSGVLLDMYGLRACLYGAILALFTSGVLGVVLANNVMAEKLRGLVR